MISYEEAFFAHDEIVTDEFGFHRVAQLETTAHHEAGHAVVGFLLGRGCVSVSVTQEVVGDGIAYSGTATSAKAPRNRVNRELRRVAEGKPFDLNQVLRAGILSAAGVAAEIRFCRECGIACHSLDGSAEDHEILDGIAKQLSATGRNRFAFRRY